MPTKLIFIQFEISACLQSTLDNNGPLKSPHKDDDTVFSFNLLRLMPNDYIRLQERWCREASS